MLRTRENSDVFNSLGEIYLVFPITEKANKYFSCSLLVSPQFGNMPTGAKNVSEGTAINTEIFRVQATDYDGDAIKYHMTSSPSSGAITYFAINHNSKLHT